MTEGSGEPPHARTATATRKVQRFGMTAYIGTAQVRGAQSWGSKHGSARDVIFLLSQGFRSDSSPLRAQEQSWIRMSSKPPTPASLSPSTRIICGTPHRWGPSGGNYL